MKELTKYVTEKLKINKNFNPIGNYNYKKGDVLLIVNVSQSDDENDIFFDIIKLNHITNSGQNKYKLWGDSIISRTALMGSEYTMENDIDVLYHIGQGYSLEDWFEIIFPEYRIEAFLQALNFIKTQKNNFVTAVDIFNIICQDIMNDIFNIKEIKEKFGYSDWQNDEYNISSTKQELYRLTNFLFEYMSERKEMISLKTTIKEALESYTINDLTVTYECSKDSVYINCPETYQEDDIHQYIDDLLLEQMPSNQDIAKKYFRNNVKYINDAYFEYDGFMRLGSKQNPVDIDYKEELGKDVPSDIKIVTFKLTNLRFKMMFAKFDIMLEDDNDVDATIDKIFSAYESNDYNDTDITFKYTNCEYAKD